MIRFKMTTCLEACTLYFMYGAVDIGGTKTLLAVFDENGSLIEQIKFPTPELYENFRTELADNVAKLSTKDFKGIGVAAPGKIDHEQGSLIAGGNLKWQHTPLHTDIEQIFKAPVRVENDAKAAALSEARLAGPEYKKVVYITISTGIGVGVCVDGEIDGTLRDSEIGRMKIDHLGEMVPWETIASGSALVRMYGKRASEQEDPEVWKQMAHNIAKGMIAIIAMVQPNLIVFGGGAGAYLDRFYEPLLKELEQYENPLAPTPPIRKAVHPEEAVVYGCYELAKEHF